MNYCKGCKYAGLDGMDCYSCSAGSNYVPNELELYKKEIAELKNKNCWKACEYAAPKSQWISQHIQDVEQLAKAKELIKEMLSILPKENIEGVYEITEEAEQFIREAEK